MLDYIGALLQALEDSSSALTDPVYAKRLAREEAAWETLRAALDDRQLALFRAYEDAHALCEMAYGDFHARRVFLLAREIFR